MTTEGSSETTPEFTLIVGSALVRGLAKAFQDVLVLKGENVCFLDNTDSAPVNGALFKTCSALHKGLAQIEVAPQEVKFCRIVRLIWIVELVTDQHGHPEETPVSIAPLREELKTCSEIIRQTGAHLAIVTHAPRLDPSSETLFLQTMAADVGQRFASYLRAVESTKPMSLFQLETTADFRTTHTAFWLTTAAYILKIMPSRLHPEPVIIKL